MEIKGNGETTGADKLIAAVRDECHAQVDNMLDAEVDDEGHTLQEVIAMHCAVGYGVNVSISVRHPEEGDVELDEMVVGVERGKL